MRRLLLVPLLAALAGPALIGPAFAQTFPPVPWTTKVFDGANLLSDPQEQTIARLSRDFQRDTGAPIVVATLASLDRYEAKSLGVQKYATALFNEWRIGKRSANGGILLVVAKADRKVWVALGKDWGRRYDAKTQAIVRGTITPLFKQGRFGDGIVQGCQALAHLADAPSPASSSGQAQDFAPEPNAGVPSDEAPLQGEPTPSGDFFPVLGLACFFVPIVLFALIAIGRRRRSLYGHRSGFASGPGPNGAYRPNDPRDFVDRRDDSGDFLTGFMVGQAMSQPPVYDPAPFDPNPFDNGPGFDPGPGFDSGPDFDSGSSSDSGFDSGSSSDSGSDSGGFDSGSSDGGGGGGDW